MWYFRRKKVTVRIFLIFKQNENPMINRLSYPDTIIVKLLNRWLVKKKLAFIIILFKVLPSKEVLFVCAKVLYIDELK